MLELAQEYYYEEDFVQSLGFAEMLLNNSEKFDDSLYMAKAFELKGRIYTNANDYQESINNYLSALYLFEKLGEIELVAKTKTNIGNLYVKIDQFDNAFTYLFNAQDYYKRDTIKCRSQLIDISSYIGIAYGSIDSLEKALMYFQKTIGLIGEKDSSESLGGLYNNIGAIYSKNNNNEQALNYYEKALQIFHKVGSLEGVGVTKSNIAFIFSKEERFNDAILLYNEAIDIFKERNLLLYLSNSYFTLSEIYENIGNTTKALYYQKEYVELKDSLVNTEVLGKIADLQMQYEIKKKDNEMEVLEREKKLIEQKNKLKEIQKYFLISGLILFLIVGILIYRNLRIALKHNKLKQQLLNVEINELNQELSFKSKETENLALHLIQRNDILSDVQKSLKSIKKHVNESTNIKINELSLKINHFIKGKEEVKKLQEKLDEINAEFYNRLRNSFPDLTKNEVQLCALIKLGLSSKEIALLNNVSERAIITARYRMRKKINIATDQSLFDFIKNLS